MKTTFQVVFLSLTSFGAPLASQQTTPPDRGNQAVTRAALEAENAKLRAANAKLAAEVARLHEAHRVEESAPAAAPPAAIRAAGGGVLGRLLAKPNKRIARNLEIVRAQAGVIQLRIGGRALVAQPGGRAGAASDGPTGPLITPSVERALSDLDAAIDKLTDATQVSKGLAAIDAAAVALMAVRAALWQQDKKR